MLGGCPDLDLRPAEMKRSTMDVWIQECPQCGYTSESVSDYSGVTEEWLKSEKYLSCDGINFISELAERFYRCYLIKLEDQNVAGAFYAVLHAAWACDDASDDDNAKHCRALAIPLATELSDGNYEDKENIMVVKADLMRRTGKFNELIEEYSPIRFKDDTLNRILEFENKKAKIGDISRYCLDDVIR